MSITDIEKVHFDRLDQRRRWLTERIKAKQIVGWDIEYDTAERDALSWVLLEIATLKPEFRGQQAPEPDPVETRIWRDGVELLVRAGGNNREVRSLLGRLAKENGKPELARAIAETQATNPADPRRYLMGVVTGRDRMQVGRSQIEDAPPPQCSECSDTKAVFVPKPNAKYSFEAIEAPCPSCTTAAALAGGAN